MSAEFVKLIVEIGEAIEKRTINHPKPEMMYKYEKGEYNPFFSIVKRGDELVCLWCSNRKITDKKLELREKELARLSESRCREGLTPEEWDAMALKVMHGLGLEL